MVGYRISNSGSTIGRLMWLWLPADDAQIDETGCRLQQITLRSMIFQRDIMKQTSVLSKSIT
jgi:hypothetical protein